MMSVSREEVRHVASLARIALSEEQVTVLAQELSSILVHMDALTPVDTDGVQEAIGVGARGLPVRGDHGPPIPLERSLDAFVPQLREGLLLVPRLETHDTPRA